MKFREFTKELGIFFVTCMVVGIIASFIVPKTVYLTNDEVNYYHDIANTVWNKGLGYIQNDKETYIKFDTEKEKVDIFPVNTSKQSLTVDFSTGESIATVNDPKANYLASVLFCSFFFGFLTYIPVSISFFKNSSK